MPGVPLPSPVSPPAEVRYRDAEFVGRHWAIAKLAKWQRARVAWTTITGPPGIGKSALAARLVTMSRRLSGRDVGTAGVDGIYLHAAAFCRHQDFVSHEPRRMIAGLALQLSNSVPGYAEKLVAAQDDRGITLRLQQNVGEVAAGGSVTAINGLTISDPDPRKAWNNQLREPLAALRDEGRLPAPIRILIDGLDESAGVGEGTLAYLLGVEADRPLPGVSFIITTRPGAAAQRAGLVGRGEVLDLLADQPPDSDDAVEYARRTLTSRFPQTRAERLAADVGAAGKGNFLYVTHVVGDILAGRLAAAALPSGLPDYYRNFLNRRIAADTDAWRRAYRPVLGAVAESKGNGLTRRQLLAILGGHHRLTRDLTLDDVLDDCRPYLAGDPPPEGPFQLYHQSFRDYLRAPGEHHIYPDEANRDIITGLVDGIRRAGQVGWQAADSYTRRHLLQHAIALGEQDDLLADLEFVVYADAESLSAALPGLVSSPAAEATALLGLDREQHADVVAEPERRRELMAVNALRTGRAAAHATLVAGADARSALPFLRWAATVPGMGYGLPGVAYAKIEGRTHVCAAFFVDRGESELHVWDASTGVHRDDLTVPLAGDQETTVAGLPGSADGRVVIVGYDGPREVIYDFATGEAEFCFGHFGSTNGAAAVTYGDQTYVALVGDDDGDFHSNPDPRGTLHVDPVPAGKYFAFEIGKLPVVVTGGVLNETPVAITWDPSGAIKSWDLNDPLEPTRLVRASTRVSSLAFCADGADPMLLATGPENVIYHLGRREIAHRLAARPGRTGQLVRMSHGELLAVVGDYDDLLSIAAPGRPDRPGHLQLPDQVNGLAVNDDELLAIAFDKGMAVVDLAGWWRQLSSDD